MRTFVKRMEPLLPHLLLLLGAFILYAGSFGHQWTMDDYVVVARNTDIRSLQGFLADSYPGRPLREITYLLDYFLFGSEPAGYHIQNIAWHALNASLIFLIARALGGTKVLAWLAASLFLVHPINVEVVANISHRKDSLMLAFALLVLLAMINCYRQSRRWQWGVAGASSLALSALAKQSAVGILPVILGYEWAMVPQERRIVFRRPWVMRAGLTVLFLAVAGVFLFVWQDDRFRLSMSECLVNMNIYSDWTNWLYLMFVLKSVAFMFLRLVWPFDLAMEYMFAAPTGLFDPWVLGGIFLLLSMFAGLWISRRQPVPFCAVLTMLGFWVPVSNLLWPISYFAADRYMYSICAGFALLMAWCAVQLAGAWQKPLIGGWLVLLLLLAGLTWAQDQIWSSDTTLFRQAYKVSPESTKSMMGLGISYMNERDYESARTYLEKAALNLNDSKPLYLLGLLHDKMGNTQNAISYYKKFAQMNEEKYRQEVLGVKRYLQMKYGISVN